MSHHKRATSFVGGAFWFLAVCIALGILSGNCFAVIGAIVAVMVAVSFFNGLEQHRKD